MNALLLGVCGSSMARAALEISNAIESEYSLDVTIILTPDSEKFCLEQVRMSRFSVKTNDDWGDSPLHVNLARSHDCMLVAPATMNSLAKLASGCCDNLLLATLLCCEGPIALLPAGNSRMWRKPSIQRAVDLLKGDGIEVHAPMAVDSESGGVEDGVGFDKEMVLRAVAQLLARRS